MKLTFPRVFYGWWVVAACGGISLFITGIIGFGFTSLIEPLSDKYGWSYAEISLATSLRGLEVGLLAPVAGFMVDRWGSRRLMLIGVIFCGVAMLLLSRVSTLPTFYATFALVALGMTFLSPTVTMTTIANWFRRQVGQATGVMHSGVGFSGLLLPVVATLIDRLGIDRAMVILGVTALVVIAPLALLIRNRPQDMGLLPDGDSAAGPRDEVSPTVGPDDERAFTVRQAVRTKAFWLFGITMLFQLLLVNAMSTHMMPFLTSIGISRGAGALISAAVPLTSVLGRLGLGWLSDRASPRLIMVAGYALVAVGLGFFTLSAFFSSILLVPAILSFSIGFGGNATVRASLLREYYGLKSFGKIHGLVMVMAVIGTMVGPTLAGWAFDQSQTYAYVLPVFTAMAIVPVLLMMAMRRPDQPRESLSS